MRALAIVTAFLGVMFAGAIFGFFYAWLCSTMWGLDTADPRVAMAAMQAMNGSVRNAVFAPAFFGTPVVLALAALLAARVARGAGLALGAAALVYAVAALFVTLQVNVPMNEVLAVTPVPDDIAAAREIWAGYSPRWQEFNLIRTVASGVSLALAVLGFGLLGDGLRDITDPRLARER